MELNTRLANYILTIAQEKNITRAAQKLYISQPSLTLAVQRLEEQIGAKIFYRDGYRLQPTRVGAVVVDACSRIVKLSRDLENEIEDTLRSYRGRVVVGMPYNLGVHLFPLLFSIYRQEYPTVKMIPVEARSVELEQQLLDGAIDVALIPLPLPTQSAQLYTQPLISERMLLSAPPGHPIGKTAVDQGERYPFVNLRAAQKEDFVLGPPNQRVRVLCDQIFKAARITPNIVYISKNIDGQRMMSAAGMGMAIFPEHYQEFYPLSQKADYYYLLPPCDLRWDIVMVYRGDAYLSTPARECCTILSRLVAGQGLRP